MKIQKYSKEFHDQIAALVCHHFDHILPKKGKPLPNEWTTLAAIVQSTSNPSSTCPENLSVVSCATGTRCLGQGSLSQLGDVVHDSHAEVLSRRCFLLYLFDQLKLCKSAGPRNSIFNRINENSSDSPPPQYKLKEGFEFHLFVSQLPCGDSAIIVDEKTEITETDHDSKNEEEPSPKKQKVEMPSVHRTGAKLQAGPLIYEEVQTVGKCRVKPGKGDPTLSMSCSDKIAKWQILGLQGCLLSNLLSKPIRLSSITIGGGGCVPFSVESMRRAIYQRFEDELSSLILDDEGCNLKKLLEDYSVPSFAQGKDNFSNYFEPSSETERKHPCPSSIVWYQNNNKFVDSVQVIVNGRRQGATKKSIGKPSSMVDICRRNILQLFNDFYLPNANDTPKSYKEAKRINRSYVKCWSLVRSKLMIGWTDKPDNIQDFSL